MKLEELRKSKVVRHSAIDWKHLERVNLRTFGKLRNARWVEQSDCRKEIGSIVHVNFGKARNQWSFRTLSEIFSKWCFWSFPFVPLWKTYEGPIHIRGNPNKKIVDFLFCFRNSEPSLLKISIWKYNRISFFVIWNIKYMRLFAQISTLTLVYFEQG